MEVTNRRWASPGGRYQRTRSDRWHRQRRNPTGVRRSLCRYWRLFTHLGKSDELVVVGHEDGNLLAQAGEQTVDIAVNLGDLDVGVAVLCELSDVIYHGTL